MNLRQAAQPERNPRQTPTKKHNPQLKASEVVVLNNVLPQHPIKTKQAKKTKTQPKHDRFRKIKI
jgi:hypothetical protein